MRAAGFAVFAASALAAGCAVTGQDDEAAYQRVLFGGAPAAEPPAAGAALGLRDAMLLAIRRDEALAAEGEGYARALIDRRRAAAAFLPRLSLSPRQLFRDRTGVGDAGHSSLDVPVEGEMSLNPVADAAGIDFAEADAASLRERLLALRDDLLLTVGRACYAVLTAERRASVLRESLDVQEAHVDDARARLDAGLERPLAVALAESRAADARAGLIAAETDARNARTALSFLTGWDVGAAPVAEAGEFPPAAATTDAAVAEAIPRRAEVRAAERGVEAASAAVEAAFGERWPSVSVDLAFYLSRDSEPTEADWTSLLRLDVPLFRAGLVEADIRESLSRARESKLRLSRARRAVRSEIESVRQTLDSTASRIEALRVRLEAARRALDLADAELSAGIATWLERLTAQDDLLTVELDLASAELGRRELELVRLRAEGRIAEFAGLPAPQGDGR